MRKQYKPYQIRTANLISKKSASAVSFSFYICNETKNNISHVKTCFDQIIFFLQNDVQTQFTELVQETQDYYQSIQEIQVIISEIAEASETFVNTVQNIQNQIHAISDVPDSDHISSQDILEKARQTEETTQEMSVIVNHNKENALEINNIVERFSWKNDIFSFSLNEKIAQTRLFNLIWAIQISLRQIP